MEGHKVEGCKGKWIHIGTLTRPRLEKCSECRGVRDRPVGDEPSEGEVVDAKANRAEGMKRLAGDLKEQLTVEEMEELNRWFADQERPLRLTTGQKVGLALCCAASLVAAAILLWGKVGLG